MIDYKSLRTKIIALIIVLFNTFSPQTVFSQEKTTEKELAKLILQLKTAGIDTFLILNSGCVGCHIIQNENSKVKAYNPSLFILIQKRDHFNFSLNHNLNDQLNITTDTSSIFDFIFSNKLELSKKDSFYKKETAKFKTDELPVPSHYDFDYLEIYSPNFNYELKIINKKDDGFGFKSDKEKWFILSQEIIHRVVNQFK